MPPSGFSQEAINGLLEMLIRILWIGTGVRI